MADSVEIEDNQVDNNEIENNEIEGNEIESKNKCNNETLFSGDETSQIELKNLILFLIYDSDNPSDTYYCYNKEELLQVIENEFQKNIAMYDVMMCIDKRKRIRHQHELVFKEPYTGIFIDRSIIAYYGIGNAYFVFPVGIANIGTETHGVSDIYDRNEKVYSLVPIDIDCIKSDTDIKALKKQLMSTINVQDSLEVVERLISTKVIIPDFSKNLSENPDELYTINIWLENCLAYSKEAESKRLQYEDMHSRYIQEMDLERNPKYNAVYIAELNKLAIGNRLTIPMSDEYQNTKELCLNDNNRIKVLDNLPFQLNMLCLYNCSKLEMISDVNATKLLITDCEFLSRIQLQSLTCLSITNRILNLSFDTAYFQNVKYLSLVDFSIDSEESDDITLVPLKMPNVEYMCINNSNVIFDDKEDINLKWLKITGSYYITSCPYSEKLMYLNCIESFIAEIPSFPNLIYLNANSSKLKTLPDLPKLKYLYAMDTKLKKIPNTYTNLIFLNVSKSTKLKKLPKECLKMKVFICRETSVNDLPQFSDELIALDSDTEDDRYKDLYTDDMYEYNNETNTYKYPEIIKITQYLNSIDNIESNLVNCLPEEIEFGNESTSSNSSTSNSSPSSERKEDENEDEDETRNRREYIVIESDD